MRVKKQNLENIASVSSIVVPVPSILPMFGHSIDKTYRHKPEGTYTTPLGGSHPLAIGVSLFLDRCGITIQKNIMVRIKNVGSSVANLEYSYMPSSQEETRIPIQLLVLAEGEAIDLIIGARLDFVATATCTVNVMFME